MSRSDRVIGITLGLLVGLAALILFVFLGSGETIDAPALDSGASSTTTTTTGEAAP